MGRTKNIIKWILPILFVSVSSIISHAFSSKMEPTIRSSEVFTMVNDLTDGYRIKQIIFSLVLFVAGYLIVECVVGITSSMACVFLALPTAVVIWGGGSTALLFTGIPYNTMTAIGVFIVLALALCGRKLSVLRNTDWLYLIRTIFWVYGFSVIASSGILPIFMSSDSYYYVMQYGEVIAKSGMLSYDTSGTTMTWTGVSSALISSFATLFGFETITVIHWGLIASMLGCFATEICRRTIELCSKRYVLAFVMTFLLLIMPPFLLLSTWVISNTYCMVMFFFLMLGLKAYTEAEERNHNLLWLLSALCVWLCLSRAEVCVSIAGLVLISSILKLDRKEMLILSVPMAASQSAFLIKLVIQQNMSSKDVYDSMITPQIMAIMMVALWGAVVYSAMSECRGICRIKKQIPKLTFIGLPILCGCIFFLDREKFMIGAESIGYNLAHEYWGYVPIFIVTLIVLFFVISRRADFYIIFSYAYVFLNLALCFGRKQPLRHGFGDSCNRILISALPIVYLALACSILNGIIVRRLSYEKKA